MKTDIMTVKDHSDILFCINKKTTEFKLCLEETIIYC